MVNKMTHNNTGRTLKVFDYDLGSYYPVHSENIFDMRQADLLIGDVGDVVKFVKQRHPYSNIVLVHGCKFNELN